MIKLLSKSILSLMITQLVAGCVSTEELYARYDNALCPAPATELLNWHSSVTFAYNSAVLTQEAKLQLQENLKLLNDYPDYRIALRGFADSVASQRYNLPLSQRRADSVAVWLLAQGVAANRIDQQWLGKSLLLTTPVQGQDQPQNRRVEMLLLDNQNQPVMLNSSPVGSIAKESL